MSQQSDDLIFKKKTAKVGFVSYLIIALVLIVTFI